MDRELHDKLQLARQLLGPAAGADLAQVLDRALSLLIEQRMKQRFAKTDRPRRSSTPPKPNSRHIPAQVRRAVFERDGLRCTFVGDDGQRCPECTGLELHHEHPHARGGPATVDNVRILCRAHNQLQAERDYSPLFMQEKRAPGGRSAQA